MKQLSQYLIEKLHVSKYQDKYNPDELDSDTYVLYDSQSYENEDDEAVEWEDCNDTLERFNKNYVGFIVCKWKSLGDLMKSNNLKDIEKTLNDYSDDLTEIKDRIITGKDLGYEIKLNKGHLEFNCLNSGSRATYYVYALDGPAFADIETWFDTPEDLDGNDDSEKLSFLFQKGNIIPIVY